MVLKINKGQSIAADEEPVKKEEKVKLTGTSLSTVLAAITKQKGDKVFSTGAAIPKVSRLPTGIFEFDLATGGGFPRARYSIVYGDEGSGKTNLAFCAVAQAQKLPPPCNKAIWIDLETTFDPEWAKLFGVDVEELIVVRPSYGEEASDLVDALVRADDVACLVVDSLAALIGVKEVKRSAEDFDVGTTPLLVKRMCTKMVQALSEEEKDGHTPAVIFLNQTRMKIGVMFGNPETQPGGKAMLFYSVLTIRLSGKKVYSKELGTDMPAFMETSAIIKKAKVQVTQVNFNYDMCLLPHNGLAVGETDSWNNVSAHLKAMGLLKKVDKGQGWTLFGLTYPTLVVFQDKYASEPEWAMKCQQAVTHAKSIQGFYLEGSGIDNGKD